MASSRFWRPAALRLATRDARRHWVRTVLATLVVALPVTALVAGTALTQSGPPSRDRALEDIPDGVQAVVTATAITRDGSVFPQLPEGAPGTWIDDLEQVPASHDELAALLPEEDRLLAFWNSPTLLVTTGLNVAPGDQSEAGAGVEGVALAEVTSAVLQEAEQEALPFLLPSLSAGAAPADATEVVITTALGARLGIGVGDTLTWVAPPFNGWYSTGGRIGEVIQDSQRAYRVSGLVDDTALRGWAIDGWISAMAKADPAGVDGHWLVVGDEPVTWDIAQHLNELQAFAVSRNVLENYPSADELYPVEVDTATAVTQAATTLLTGILGAALALLLVTPAFAVSAEQSRRTLGMAAAAGAAPADLRRTLTAQGLGIGLAGGLLGVALGAAAAVTAVTVLGVGPEVADPTGRFPWKVAVAAIFVAVVVGIVATLGPARRAARLPVVDALKDLPAQSRRQSRRVITAVAGLVLLIAAAVAGAAALTGAAPSGGYVASGTVPVSSALPLAMLVLCLLLAVAGLLVTVRALLSLASRAAGRLPAVWRLAVRDAADHRSRFLPAASAVLVAVAAASFLTVTTGSSVANQRDQTGEMVAAGHLVLGVQVPVSEGFDRLVLADAIDTLADELPVTGNVAIRTTDSDGRLHLGLLPAEGAQCPDGEEPDTASATRPGTSVTCVPYERAYVPGLSVAWWGGTDVYVLDGDALRASGLSGSEEAAAVLDAGGVVVNNAARIGADGTARIAVSTERAPTEADADRIVSLDAVFLRGFAPPLTISADAAQALGIDSFEYVGEYVTTSRPLTLSEIAAARSLLDERTSLVWIGEAQHPRPWGRDDALLPILALTLLATLATAITLTLARSQGARDAATMHAVGATNGFLRQYGLVQAGVVLLTGIPLGIITGIALGTLQIEWNRRAQSGGAWLDTIPLWGVQAGIVLAVVIPALAVALIAARPPRGLVRRPAD